METIINLISINGCGDELRRKLVAVYPEGQLDYGPFRFELSMSDPRSTTMIDLIEAAGFERLHPGIANPRWYKIQLSRKYSEQDLLAANYLVPKPIAGFDAGGMTEGRLRIEPKKLLPNQHIAYGGGLLVSDVLKNSIESRGLVGATFHPVTYARPTKSLPPFWELSSSASMPRLSPRMKLSDFDGNPYNYSSEEPCYLKEGFGPEDSLFKDPELFYRAQDLTDMPAFDVARTFERIGGFGARTIVVSQGFYALCRELDVEADWQLIHIE